MKGKVDIPELVARLERAGVEEVKYYHFPNWNSLLCYSRGPVTACDLYKQDIIVAHGFAHLHPCDQFCRRTGRIVALRRAIYNLDLKGRRNRTVK